MAVLLNLARDGLWGRGLATYEEKSGPDQRVLAEHLGAPPRLVYSHVGEKPGKQDKATLPASSISLRPSDPKIPEHRKKKRKAASETSHVARAQQLAGPTNKL